MKRLQQNFPLYFLIVLILIGVFLRFYNFPYRYSLGEETVRDAVIGIEGARQIQFPLTGSFSSLGPFTFGPWYAYQFILFHFFVPFNYSPWIYFGIISILYIFFMYKIGELLGSKTFGLILATLVTFSPAQVISGTHLTSHNNTNLFAALAIWIFLKIFLKKDLSYWWGFFLGFVIGIGMNLHFQMSGLLIFPLLLLIFNRKRYMYFICAALGVLAAFIPMFIFESNNHWFNTRNIFYYLIEGKNAMYVPNRWLFYIRDFWPSFWADALGIPPLFAGIIILLFLILFLFSIYKRKVSLPFVLLVVSFSLIFISLRYYWGPRFFGYLNFVRPFVFIFTTYAIFQIGQYRYGKIVAGVLIAGIILFSFPRNIDQLQKDPFSQEVYDNVKILEEKYPNKKFAIYKCFNYFRSSYNSKVYSVLFVLDTAGKLDSSGIKVGLKSQDCEYPNNIVFDTIQGSPSGDLVEKVYPSVPKTDLVDLSKANDNNLKKSGWGQITFSTIYNEYARWWYVLQP